MGVNSPSPVVAKLGEPHSLPHQRSLETGSQILGPSLSEALSAQNRGKPAQTVHQSGSWNWRLKRCETVHSRYRINVQIVLLAVSKSIFSFL